MSEPRSPDWHLLELLLTGQDLPPGESPERIIGVVDMAQAMVRSDIARIERDLIRKAMRVYELAPNDLARRAIIQRLAATLRRSPNVGEVG